jgi:hypothetical protein
MRKDLWSFIKIVNGIYLLSSLYWIFYIMLVTNSRHKNLVLTLLLISITEIILFAISVAFFFVTKNIFNIKEQIKYALIIFMVIIDIYYLKSGSLSVNGIAMVIYIFNLLSILYFIKNALNIKKSCK